MINTRLDNKDFLTSLYNRECFLKYIHSFIENNTEFSLFNIDLNNFKSVNDIYGHDIGDIVLKEVGLRFKSLEDENIIFSRFGGDEFALLFKTANSQKINALGKKINEVLFNPIIVSESEFHISASVGVARFPMDSDNISDLLKLSDMAVYHSKKSGIYDHYLISEELNQKLTLRKKIEKLLRNIDIDNDLFLEYQPIFDLNTGQLKGMEALVRWKHKTEGIIYPRDFIGVSEEIDIVKDITKWVFIKGLHQIKQWNETYNKNLKISLNVSNSCIHNRIFFGNLQFMLENFGINPKWLILELTEVSLSVSPEYMKRLLANINELGVDIYLDDFGTSPIMLTDLKDFKVKAVKIDNKHISSLKDENGSHIVKAMILLAHGLGINSLAEGVETKEQYELLKKYTCDEFQGFYKQKPLNASEFEEKYLKN